MCIRGNFKRFKFHIYTPFVNDNIYKPAIFELTTIGNCDHKLNSSQNVSSIISLKLFVRLDIPVSHMQTETIHIIKINKL